MSFKNRRSRLAIATICVTSVFAAACSDDDKDSAPETTAAPETTGGTETTMAPETTMAAPTGTEIVIGLVYSETGRTAGTYGSTDTVANAWAEWVNTEMGGVNGHPVKIAAVDGLSTAEGAAAAVRDAVESQGAVAIIIQDSTAENAIAQYLAEKGIPMIGGTANGRPSDSGEAHWPNNYFNTAPSNPSSAAATMVAAKAAGATKYSAAVCAEVPACAQAGALYGAISSVIGIEYVGLVTVGAADPSYTAPCLELIGKGTDIINLGLATQTASAVIDECTAQGYEGWYASGMNSVTARGLEGVDGLKMAGAINGFPWWADDPAVETFRTAVETYGNGDDVRDPSSTTTWSALELFRKSVGANGPAADADVTAADILAVYQAISGETLDGLLPSPITYTAEGFQPLIPCFWLFTLEGGEFTTITNGESGNGASGDLQSSCFKM